ncbi:MAG TPA: YitT family protein [Clostridia bacterium]|nr:YitT family protein [Clostridia bacterium]
MDNEKGLQNENSKSKDINAKKFDTQEAKKLKQQKYMKFISIYIFAIALALVRAIGSYVFLVPNGFAPGGVGGIATIIYNIVLPFNEVLALTWFNPAVTVFVMNIPLFIVAFVKLNRRFAFRTFVCVTAFSIFMGVFSAVKFPTFYSTNYESVIMFLGAITGGALCGVGLGFMLKFNMSLGGTDIIGKLVYKKNPVADLQWIIFLLDCIVVIASGSLGLIQIQEGTTSTEILIHVLSPILYSFVSLYVTSKVAEVITTGLESSLVFQIITDFPEEIAAEITAKTKRGVSIVSSEGFYTHLERKILICVARKKQISQIKLIIKKYDSNAFVFITNARQVTGKGFEINTGE